MSRSELSHRELSRSEVSRMSVLSRREAHVLSVPRVVKVEEFPSNEPRNVGRVCGYAGVLCGWGVETLSANSPTATSDCSVVAHRPNYAGELPSNGPCDVGRFCGYAGVLCCWKVN